MTVSVTGQFCSDNQIQYEPRNQEEADKFLDNLRHKEYAPREAKYKEKYPSFFTMVKAVWSTPIVKFWTWFLIYTLFLILLGTDMMLPSCRYLGVDIAVFVITGLMWLELLTR